MFNFDTWLKKIGLMSLIILVGILTSLPSEAKLLVVGTTEHEALLAKQVGGNLIDVKWIVSSEEDPHLVEPNKTFVPMLNKADLLLVNGQQLEMTWLGFLLTDNRNEKINRDQEGNIDLSEGASILPYTQDELRQTKFYPIILGMGMGKNVGNHHYWLDPANEIPMINNIKKALTTADPANSKTYESNADGLISRLEEKMKEWDAKMAPFKGKKIISFHRDWNNLAHRHGLEVVGYVEQREGLRPTESDYSNLANRVQNRGVAAVLLTESQKPPYVDMNAVNGLVSKIHSKAVVLPDSLSESGKRTDIVALFDQIYEEITAALK